MAKSKVIDKSAYVIEYNNCDAAISLLNSLITEIEACSISLLSSNDKLCSLSNDNKINELTNETSNIINDIDTKKENIKKELDKLISRKEELSKIINTYDKKHNKKSLFRKEGDYYE